MPPRLGGSDKGGVRGRAAVEVKGVEPSASAVRRLFQGVW